jgi:hypothetical protein
VQWNTIIKKVKYLELVSIVINFLHIPCVIHCRIQILCEHILNTLWLVLRTEQGLCVLATALEPTQPPIQWGWRDKAVGV